MKNYSEIDDNLTMFSTAPLMTCPISTKTENKYLGYIILCIGLYHEIVGKESKIDYWTIHSEPQIDIMGSVQQHAHDWILLQSFYVPKYLLLIW